MPAETAPIAGRSCDGCTYCCVLPEIDHFDKPADMPCRHCVDGQGCAIYAERPALCRDFLCLWRTDAGLGPEWRPVAAHMLLYRQGPQLTVLVDPAVPQAWKAQEPQLRRWAAEAAAEGGYVIVFAGDAVFRIASA